MYLSSNKLSLKFFGPLEILEKFPPIAYYKFKLPATSAIHLVVHVSQMKIAFVIAYYVIKWFVSIGPSGSHATSFACGDASIAQVLVSWPSLPNSLVTWENIMI